ncbi:unnamed protein product [Protopolystoma xenopodis]|uniref:Uncharacterized protein n=1 Tax=Protopolystoma xenopodis TaxID=117903 RepID=A0A3S5B593_9PLAT|nr:unnamed protein product [Protopolystoma xenopodis]
MLNSGIMETSTADGEAKLNSAGKPAATGKPEQKRKRIRIKEKSVLQAKLTRLAIQIGYLG